MTMKIASDFRLLTGAGDHAGVLQMHHGAAVEKSGRVERWRGVLDLGILFS